MLLLLEDQGAPPGVGFRTSNSFKDTAQLRGPEDKPSSKDMSRDRIRGLKVHLGLTERAQGGFRVGQGRSSTCIHLQTEAAEQRDERRPRQEALAWPISPQASCSTPTNLLLPRAV